MEEVRKMLLVAMLGSTSFLFSQTVCVGTSQQQCIEAQKQKCASEPAPANFELPKDRVVQGTVADTTGESFQGVEVQLRIPKTGSVVQSVAAKDGTFNLGMVNAGFYRLIVVKQGEQGIKRLRMWDQPKSLVCADSTSAYRISVVLTLHGTDNTIDFCPPK
ncbi:MAG: carboxypeptidase-like regulatory domain-containing protein [Acidobacteriaceae bacterium]